MIIGYRTSLIFFCQIGLAKGGKGKGTVKALGEYYADFLCMNINSDLSCTFHIFF